MPKSMPKSVPKNPMETSGFGWRVGLSILVVFAIAISIVLWLLFFAGKVNIYQNIAFLVVVMLAGMGILGASWASWGVRYAMLHKDKWNAKMDNHDCSEFAMKNNMRSHGGNAVYGLGFIGAVFYFISNAVGIGGIVLAIVKAIFWPAFLVYGVLKFLGM